MGAYTKIVSSLLFPLHERLKRHSTVEVRRELDDSQWWSRARIEDPQGGTEGYTFDLEWNGAGSGNVGQNRGGQQGGGFGGGPGRDDRGRGRDFNRRMTADEAIRTCEDAIIDQALDRLRVAAIVIRRTAIDEGTGRRDWVFGNFETRLGPGRGRERDMYRFQCSVNFESGRVRSADFQPGQ